MRKLISGVFFIVVLAFLLIAAAVFLVPKEVYKSKVEEQVSALFGRTVTIEGPVSLYIWPTIQVRAADVHIANPKGFMGRDFTSMRELRTSVAFLPLLSKRVEIKELILDQPEISLERLANGAVNWAIGNNESAKVRAKANSGFKRRPGALPLQASLGDMRLIKARISYNDRATKASHTLENANFSIHMPALDKRMTTQGTFLVDGHKANLVAALGSLQGFLEGAQTPLTLDLKSDLLTAEFEGQFDKSEAIKVSGDMKLDVPSVRALAKAAAIPLPASKGVYGPFSITGFATASLHDIRFERARIGFDAIKGTGSFFLNIALARPVLTGKLDVDTLDLTPYLPPQSPPGSGIAAWSDVPYNFSMLRAIDARFDFTLGTLKMRQLKFGQSTMIAVLKNGRLQADIKGGKLYGGTGTARIVVNARGNTPSFSLKSETTGIQFLPLLTDSIKFKRLVGTGSASIDLRASGNSQKAIMQSLSGTGKISGRDGKIIGVNLASVLRSAQSFAATGTLSDSAGAEQATDFSKLDASFKITNGVLNNNDFLMLSPLMRVPGKGTVDLGNQTIDYQLIPRLVSSLKGQGGQSGLKGFGAPFRIQGPWNAIKAGIDKRAIKKVAKKKAKKAIGKLLDKNMGGNAGSALKSMLGIESPPKDPAQEGNAEPAQKSDEELALDSFMGLFKKKKKKKDETGGDQ